MEAEMNNPLNAKDIKNFLYRLGERFTETATLYLIGGGALLLLGSQRTTLDIDYVGSDYPLPTDKLASTIQSLAMEMKIEVEPVPLDEFIPLPAGAHTRHRFIGQYGKLAIYVFDPYSIAISKLDRGFATDLQDIAFLIHQQLITLEQLEQYAQTALKHALAFNIDPKEFREHLQDVSLLL
jgi:hypothetical protein